MTQPDRDRSEPKSWHDVKVKSCTCGPYAPCPIHDDAATQPPADSEGSAEHGVCVEHYSPMERWPDKSGQCLYCCQVETSCDCTLMDAIEAEARAASPVAESGLREAAQTMADDLQAAWEQLCDAHDRKDNEELSRAIGRLGIGARNARAALAAAARPRGADR